MPNAKTSKAPPAPARAVAPRRADYGKSPALALNRMNPTLRPIAEKLQKLIEAAAPDAKAALKWGQPVYSIGTKMMAVIGTHKAHVNLVVVGPAKGFKDPKKLLGGSSQGGRHIKLTNVKDVPSADVRSWVKTSAEYARSSAKVLAKAQRPAKAKSPAKRKVAAPTRKAAGKRR